MTIRRLLALLVAVAPLVVWYAAGCGGGPTVRIMAADALAHPFRRLTEDFQRRHPDVTVSLETQGSILLGRLALLRPCDVLVVSDARLVRRMLTEAHADWVAAFAHTELVLVWTDRSRGCADVTADTWWQVLLRDDVRLTLPNPDQDPCGYYTLACWSLADEYLAARGTGPAEGPPLSARLLAKCPRIAWPFDAAQMLSRLQAFQGDYGFAYRCHAEDMHLPYLRLPPEINLGAPSMAARYATVSVKVPNFRGGTETVAGSPIVFGLTMPRSGTSPAAAADFVRFCFSAEGRRLLDRSSLAVVTPPTFEVWGSAPPTLLTTESVGPVGR